MLISSLGILGWNAVSTERLCYNRSANLVKCDDFTVKAWKRRCKSTSNLLGGGAGAGAGGRMSEDSSSSVDNLALLSRCYIWHVP